MRQHPRLGSVGLQPEPGEEPSLDPIGVGPGDAIALFVDVHGRVRILAQGPIGAPCRERPGRATIAVVRARRPAPRRAGRGGRRWPDGGPTSRARVSGSMTSYGGATTAARSPDARRLEAQGAERSEVGHGSFGMTARSLRLWGPPHRTIRPVRTATGCRRPDNLRIGRNFHRGSGVLAATILPPDGSIGVRVSHQRSTRVPVAARLLRVVAAVALVGALVAAPGRRQRGTVAAVTPPPGLTMEAHGPPRRSRPRRVVDGHRRPPQERRAAHHRRAATDRAATQGRTRFGTLVEAPTQSDQTHRLYAQPPGFGRELEISLVERRRSTIATTKAAFTIHDGTQMIVGIVAERPGDVIGDLDLLPNVNNVKPLTVGLDAGRPADPRRGVGRGRPADLAGHRFDASSTADQLAAMRGWVAGGGRLIIAGGTAGPASLSAFPDDILPYRPTTTTDVAPSSLVALLGELPDGRDRPAGAVRRADRRAESLATVGDQTVAAERTYGAGAVTIIGFDPTARVAHRHAHRRGPVAAAHPDPQPRARRRSATTARSSRRPRSCPRSRCRRSVDSSRCSARYILLIGPINYLVLRRFDKREWAWVTMPALIVTFAVGRVRLRVRSCAAATSSSTRSRSSAAPRAPPKASPRRISASSRRPAARTSSASRVARCCRRRSTATSSATARRHSLDVLQGDPSRDPRPRRRLRLAADDPGRERRRPCRSSRPTFGSRMGRLQGHGHECLRGDPPGTGRRPRRHGRQARPTSRPGQTRDGRRRAPGRPAWASSCRTRSSARCSSAIRGRRGEDRRSPVRPPHHHRPADVRPELGLHAASCRPTAPVVLGWSDRELLPVEIEGQVGSPHRQRPVVPAGGHHGQRQDHVPPGPAAEHGRRPATPRSSTRTRSTSASAGARRSCPIARSSFDGHDRCHPAGDRLQLRRVRRPGRSQADRAARPTIPVACWRRPVAAASSAAFDGLPGGRAVRPDDVPPGGGCRT